MLENTIENKYKFITQYWWTDTGVINGIKHFRVNPNHICDIEYLELTPLSQITDEDAIGVARIMGVKDSDFYTEQFCHYRQATFSNYVLVGKHYLRYFFRESNTIAKVWFQYESKIIDVADYLRSKSYLIPYNRTPIETLIEYGWVKTV